MTATVAPVRAALPRPTRLCRCGCGEQTQGTWVPGHDAQAKSLLLAVARGQQPRAALAPLGDITDLVTRWSLGHVGDDGEVVLIAPPTKDVAKMTPRQKARRALERIFADLPEGHADADAIMTAVLSLGE